MSYNKYFSVLFLCVGLFTYSQSQAQNFETNDGGFITSAFPAMYSCSHPDAFAVIVRLTPSGRSKNFVDAQVIDINRLTGNTTTSEGRYSFNKDGGATLTWQAGVIPPHYLETFPDLANREEHVIHFLPSIASGEAAYGDIGFAMSCHLMGH